MATGQGAATLTFGNAASRDIHAETVITGQATIGAASKVEAYLMGDSTADHSVDEHIMAATMADLVCHTVVAGTGFTITALVRDEISKAGLVGDFSVRWVWAD